MTTTMTQPLGTADSPSPDVMFPAIAFSRLLRVEWGKATDTRASRWLLSAVAASTVGLMLVPILSPSSVEQSYTSYLGFAAVALSILLPVVAILTLTSEWSQRTNLTTFTQEPRRMRVVISKIVVSLMLGVGAAVFGALVTAAGLGVAAASGRTLDADLSAGLLVTFVAYVLLNIMTGVALGALVHNSAAAIVASFVLPIGFALLGRASPLVANWLDYSTAFNWLLNGQWSGHTAQILVAVALWVAAPLAVGLVRTVRREIN
jgi:ABC-2 type transport system permease protein